MNLSILLKFRLVLCCMSMMAFLPGFGQQTITGVVTAMGGDPLPGATVIVKGTSNGTTTDVEGNFSIDASSADILSFSFIGYISEEVLVGNRTFIDLRMTEDNQLLETVVVLGYTEKSQKEISASVVSIDSDDLQVVTSSNVQTMLQGQAAGVTVSSPTGAPGAAADIRIRGITSINSDLPPLFVVDGIIGGNYVPNDVASVTILKDAAAIGLYGAAGAAGVIIITTKRGSGEPFLNVSTTFGIKEATMGNFSMMNGQELYDTQFQMWGAQDGGSNLVSFLNNRPEDLQDQNFDWLDAAFDPAIIQNYNVAMGGGSNGNSYGLSLDYFNEEGTFITTQFERLNLRAYTRFSPIKNLTINSDINLQLNTSTFEQYSWFEDSFWNMPWDNGYDDNGALIDPAFIANRDNDWYGQFRRSFLYSADNDELSSTGADFVWSGLITYDINDWLSLESRNRIGYYNSKSKIYYSPLTDFGLATNGYIEENQENGESYLSTNFIRANKSFGEHTIGGFIAFEAGQSEVSRLFYAGQNLATNSVDVISGASEVIRPDFDNLGFPYVKFVGMSYISELSYNNSGKYFGTAYFRRDGSSVFAENNQYGNFYGGSAAWLMSDESFLEQSSLIDFLKLRVSYGTSGNSNIQPFQSLPTYNITRQYNGQPGGEPNNPSNPNLGWESSEMLNVGVDLELSNGLTANVDIYQKTVTGMLLRNLLPFSFGYEFRLENIGDMRNRGVELSLAYNREFGDFKYSGNFNVSYNQNEITRITDIFDEQIITAGAVQQINAVGSEAFSWYMPKWLGVDPETGGPMWETVEYDDNGNVTSRGVTNVYDNATFQPLESSLPDLTGGFRNTISYKSLSLSALFSFQAGNHIFHYTRFFVDSDGANTGINLMRLQDGWSRWEEPGDQATHPELMRGGNASAHQISSRFMEKGDYLRLRNITLSYKLPNDVMEKLGFTSCSVNVSVDNLKTWTEFSGMDPDIGLTASAFTLPGLSYLKYPISRQFVFGLNLNF